MNLLPHALLRLVSRRDPGARERRLVAASGLFDESYYLLNGNDLVAGGTEPCGHFCRYGWREGRRPNHFFDPGWYRATYLATSPDENPLVHYIRRGEAGGCRPICFFDPAWYRSAYGLARGVSPLAHYLVHRRSQTVAPNPLFDLDFYLARHGEEIGRNRDPFMHLVRNGAALRDCDPSASFDSAAYRRDIMAGDTRRWTGLAAHEMRVPLIHRLHASCASHEA